MDNHADILFRAYEQACRGDYTQPSISDGLRDNIRIIVSNSESSKGVYTVLTTLLTHKIHTPEDDIRYHQSQLGGFSGRTIDSKYVTPFLREKGLPAMSSTGWLTRSLEQPFPYTLDYAGSIRPRELKRAFLQIIDEVQTKGASAEDILTDLLHELVLQRDSHNIELARPHILSISQIVDVLHKHFDYPYKSHGASRLPTLAIYAAYQCIIADNNARFKGKTLCPLESHTSADSQSGQIGDIQINDANGERIRGC